MVSRDPAPGPLALVERFMRTRDRLNEPADLTRWAADNALTIADPVETFARAIRLREALRALMLSNTGAPLPPSALAEVNAEIEAYGLRPDLRSTGSSVGLRWGVGRVSEAEVLPVLLTAVLDAMVNGSWPRMKACASEDCRYAFYDHSKNRVGRWCDVAGCGTNDRMRRYRQRRGESSAGALTDELL